MLCWPEATLLPNMARGAVLAAKHAASLPPSHKTNRHRQHGKQKRAVASVRTAVLERGLRQRLAQRHDLQHELLLFHDVGSDDVPADSHQMVSTGTHEGFAQLRNLLQPVLRLPHSAAQSRLRWSILQPARGLLEPVLKQHRPLRTKIPAQQRDGFGCNVHGRRVNAASDHACGGEAEMHGSLCRS